MDLDEVYRKIALRMKSLRKQQGLTQEKLAELADVSHDYISKIEIVVDKPGLIGLHKIINALNVSYSEFFKDFN